MQASRKPPPELPRTGAVDRGEFQQRLAAGHCLLWLYPLPAPVAEGHIPAGVAWIEDGHSRRTLLVDLDLQPVVSVAREAVEAPRLVEREGMLAVRLPSSEAYQDVSRSPTRFDWMEGEGLSVSTASDRAVVWCGLTDLRGRLQREVVPAWAAVGVGPVVLWYVPRPAEQAQGLVTPALTPSPDFFALSAAADDLVRDVRRRAARRVSAPPTAGMAPWDHGEGFILAGETGVGKNVLARAAQPEAMAAARFVTVQPEEVRGWTDLVPFYGAHKLAHDGQRVRDQPGRLDVLTHADGVVLFDEIHSLDEEFRYRLLELLTYWTFRPRGDSSGVKPMRGLPLYATSRLEEVRDGGRFPADLFFRMGGDTNVVEVPPLRQRRWELPGLAARVLEGFGRHGPRGPRGPQVRPGAPLSLGPSARRKLLLHGWPGNFRELEQCLVEAASLTGAGEILPEALKIGPGASAPHALPARPRDPGGVEAGLRPAAGTVSRLAPADVADALGLPDRLRWPDLFLLTHRLPDRAALTEVLVAHRERRGLAGANARSVSKEIGRLIRCDRFPRSDCLRCFACRLVEGGAPEVIGQLAQAAVDSGLERPAVVGWITRGVERLVVDRLGRNGGPWRDARAALRAAAHGSEADLEAALAEVAQRLRAR